MAWLAAAGFDVRVPALSLRKPTPALRVFAEQTETAVGASQLADVRWSAVFDDVELTAADIARLAKEARPLIHSRGRWVALDKADLEFFAGEFTRTGFRGGLNWYRNIDRNWELLAPFAGARVTVPALYVVGDRDLVVSFPGMDQLIPNLSKFVPNLRRTIMLPGCGHWTQQERPEEVNATMVDFLRGL